MKFPFGKAAWREIKTHPGRYLAILAIVALGVGFYAGLFVIEDAMLDTANSYITEYNLYDFSVSSTLGLYEDDVKALSRLEGIKKAEGVITADAICKGGAGGSEQVLHFISIPKSIGRPEVVAGRMPKAADECLADTGRYTEDDIGKKIRLIDSDSDTFAYTEYTIVGIGNSVEFINYQRGSTSLGSGSVTAFCYIPKDGFSVDYYTAVYLDAETDAYIYSDQYRNTIKTLEATVKAKVEKLALDRGISYIKQAQDEIAKGVQAYEQGKAELERARLEAAEKFAEAEAEVAKGYEQLKIAEADFAEFEKKMELARQKAAKDYRETMAKADEISARAEEIAYAIDYATYLEVTAALEQLEEARVNLEKLLEKDPDNERYALLLDRVVQKQQDIEQDYQDLIKVMDQYEKLKAEAEELRKQAEDTKDKLELAATGLVAMQKLKLTQAKTDLSIAERKIKSERLTANSEFEKAEKQLQEAYDLLTLPDNLDELTTPKTYVLTREQNIGYLSMETDSTIVSGVVVVFPIFFVMVAALVCSTVMTRMVEDERIALGTLKAMGYDKRALMSKYLIYAGSASLIGSIGGFFIGTFCLPRVLWLAYMLMYDFTDTLLYVFNPVLMIVCVLVALAACMGTAAMCVLSAAGQMPASLMRPRVTASGKRVFFERLTLLWKPLPFLTKVAVRNIWRYKKRLLVMLLGIGGSTALLVAGFGLADSIKPLADYQYDYITTYDYKITFKDAQDAETLAEFSKRNADKIEFILPLHQSEQDAKSEHGSRKATLHVLDTAPDGYISLWHDGQSVTFPEVGKAVINTHLADLLQIGVGDALTVSSDHGELTLHISGITDNYIDNVVYISTQTYQEATGKSPEVKTALAYAPLETELDAIAAALRGDDAVAYLEDSAVTKDNLGRMMQSMNYVVITIIVCAGALAYIVLFNLTNINITERTREIATLRVIGLYRGETRRYVMTENYVLSVIGALLGMPAGVLLHRFVMSQIVLDNITFPITIAWQSYLYAFALTILFAVLVGLALRRRIDRIDMAESLKSVE